MAKQILNHKFFEIDNIRGTFTEVHGKTANIFSRTGYSFDIETTLIRETEQTFMYVGQIAVNDICYIFRTWDDILSALDKIYADGNTNNKTNIIWVANLGYEMSFMLPRLYLHFKDKATITVFADSARHPIYVRLDNENKKSCIEFRDTLRISGLNLRNTAKNYCTTQKLEMDYDEIRNSLTDITDITDYIANDVFICNEYFEYLLTQTVDKGQPLPYTQTGIVRNLVKEKYKLHVFSETKAIAKMFPKSETQYNRIMQWLYSGGITHANHDYVGDIIENVTCIDFISSYPAIMLHEKYPMGAFRKSACTTFEQLSKHKFWYATVTFSEITQTTSHSLISSSKCIKSDNLIEDNGRVMYANSITIMLTNVDYEYISKFYKWNSYRISNSYYCNDSDYLPSYLLENMLRNGQQKAELKVKGLNDTPEYFKNKALFNCYYGLCVQRLVRDTISWTYADGYVTEKSDDYAQVKSTATLSPFWGIYVTSYARRNLCINMWNIEKTGANVVYYDTDSLYIKNIDKANKVITDWNNSMYELNVKLNLNKCFHDLGAWDKDPPVTFKTLGAKRYIKVTADKHVKATIAGLPKKAFNFDSCNAFTEFKNGMEIKALDSMKLTAKYKDTPYFCNVTDKDGNTELMTELSGTSLIEIPFKLTISEAFKVLLKQLHKHY